MFQSHPNLVKPEPSAKLWRYTDFAKFLFLLERRALWFSRLDTLGDPYEGMPPRPFIEDVWTAATTAPEAERAARIEMANQNTHAFTMGPRHSRGVVLARRGGRISRDVEPLRATG